MTTPEEARKIADDVENRMGDKFTDAAGFALRDLSAQVERLEAQRKELRDMLDRVQKAGTWPDISIEIDSVLKATE